MNKRAKGVSSFSVIVAFIALSLLGLIMAVGLPVKLSPSESLPSITVSYSLPGASARTVEAEITSRVEPMLQRLGGVKHIKSRSTAGYGSVMVQFDQGANLETARFEAAMAVRQIWGEMPQNAAYPQIRVQAVNDDATRPFLSFTVNADLPPAEILQYAQQNILPVLTRLPGVAKVDLSGAQPMEWEVEYDNERGETYGITLEDISTAFQTQFRNQPLGLVSLTWGDSTTMMRVTLAPPGFESGDTLPSLNLGDIVVKNHKGQLITLDKLARASQKEAPPTGYFRINGLNSIYLNITSTETANQIDLAKTIRNALTQISLPPSFSLIPGYDASERIADELDTIYVRTLLTVLILLLFVALVTMSLRYTLLVTISLAANLAVAFAIYRLAHVEIHLYSLAGITISLNLVIDNIIVMAEHSLRHKDLKVFPAILAATLTTVGALSVVFFLDERTMLNLKDFVVVVMVNLGVSLAVALWLVPALMDKLAVGQGGRKKSAGVRPGKGSVALMRCYASIVAFVLKHRWIVGGLFLLAFGLPVFLLPEKIEGGSAWAKAYNSTIGSDTYKTTLRPHIDRWLGGTLRLFADKVQEGGYFNKADREPVLYVNATLPNGSTLPQMNELIGRMEQFLREKEGIRQFQTSVYGPRRASLTIFFTPEKQETSYPYQLEGEIVAKALTLGGGSWSVYGLEDMGFNNDARERSGSYHVKLTGYNYDVLTAIAAELRDSLLRSERIRQVYLAEEFTPWKDDYEEFTLGLNLEALQRDSLTVADLFYGVSAATSPGGKVIATVPAVSTNENVRLTLQGSRDAWGLMATPLHRGTRTFKLSDYATIEKEQTPPSIIKEDQQYILCLQYEYIGSNTLGKQKLQELLDRMNPTFPVGYTAVEDHYHWNDDDNVSRWLLLGLIVVIIFFVASIQFNSLRQPSAVILVIPVAFIGVFLTFYLFSLRFDQGGFAAFVLLCGLTVNAAIYIISAYNHLRCLRPHAPAFSLYLKAFRAKITAVLLTILSTVLGFIPFVIATSRQGFWFPLASATMGGLVASLLAILLLLPILVLPRPRTKS